MKKLLFIVIFFSSVSSFAQQLYYSLPVAVTAQNIYGNYHPRITLANGTPVITWGETDYVYTARYSGGGFNLPVQVSPVGSDIYISVVDGPVLASKGDTVYYAWYDQTGANESIVIARSFDAGITISDTQVVFASATKRVEFPEITVLSNGRILLSFIYSNLDETQPEIVVCYSDDNGLSFTVPQNVSSLNPGQPCECCPMSIISEGNFVAVGYRNNISNIRDFYVSVSYDGGTTFTSGAQIDYSSWSVSSCPTTGIDLMIQDDTLIGAWTTKPGTIFQAKTGTLNMNTLAPGFNRLVDDTPSNFIQNYPSIAGNDDTLAIVWQDNRNGSADIFMSFSLNGISQLSEPEMINTTMNLSTQQGAHMVFENGVFHIVWMDSPSQRVMYQRAKFTEWTAVEENLSSEYEAIIYPNPASDVVMVQSNLNFTRYEISDISGRKIAEGAYHGNTINFDLENGNYILHLFSENNIITRKLIVQK